MQGYLSEDLGIGRILKWTLENSVCWSHLAQDRDQWRTLVSTVMNLVVS
jgi:hypothetical protein